MLNQTTSSASGEGPRMERRTTAGPTSLLPQFILSTKRKSEDVQQSEIMEEEDVDSIEEFEKMERSLVMRRAPQKDMTIVDGKINIITQVGAHKEALCCQYSEEYDYIAAGYIDGIIRVYNSVTGELAFSLADSDVKEQVSAVTSVKHRPVSKAYPITYCFTGTYANGCVKCWSYNFNQCLYTIREKRQTLGITYHPRSPKFVTYGDDMKICFYDEESKIQERVLMASEVPSTHDGHMSRIFAACFHPRNNYEFISGGWDDVVQFWDLRQPYAIRHLSGIHICGEGLDINSKGTEVLTCAYQNTEPIQIFDYGSGKRISGFEPDIYNSKLYCGRYGIKDFIFAGGTDPNILRVIDLQTTATAASVNFLPGAVYALDLGPQKAMKRERDKDHLRLKSDVCLLPKIVFVSGKKLYQVDYY